MAETTYTVEGMTCGHCATSVREEVSELEGVRSVDVDVESGRVTAPRRTTARRWPTGTRRGRRCTSR